MLLSWSSWGPWSRLKARVCLFLELRPLPLNASWTSLATSPWGGVVCASLLGWTGWRAKAGQEVGLLGLQQPSSLRGDPSDSSAVSLALTFWSTNPSLHCCCYQTELESTHSEASLLTLVVVKGSLCSEDLPSPLAFREGCLKAAIWSKGCSL